MNETKKSALVVLISFYLTIACLTYGHAWKHGTFGLTPEQAHDPNRGEGRFYLVIGSALFWPLYWSCEVFQ